MRAPGLLGPGALLLDNESGRRKGTSESKNGNRYWGAITCEIVVAAGKTATGEGAGDQRLACRRGKAKSAPSPPGESEPKVYDKPPSSPGTRDEDLGADDDDGQGDIRREISHHVGQLGALGLLAHPLPLLRPRFQANRRKPCPSGTEIVCKTRPPREPGTTARCTKIVVGCCSARPR